MDGVEGVSVNCCKPVARRGTIGGGGGAPYDMMALPAVIRKKAMAYHGWGHVL